MQHIHLEDERQQGQGADNGYEQKQRRKLVIWTCLIYTLSILVMWFSWLGVQQHLWINYVGYIVSVLPSLVCCLLGVRLFHSIHNIILKRDSELDERQRIVRNSAFRLAFIILSYLFVILILLDMVFGLSFLTANILQRTVLFFNLLLFINGLPAVIIAWREREV